MYFSTFSRLCPLLLFSIFLVQIRKKKYSVFFFFTFKMVHLTSATLDGILYPHCAHRIYCYSFFLPIFHTPFVRNKEHERTFLVIFVYFTDFLYSWKSENVNIVNNAVFPTFFKLFFGIFLSFFPFYQYSLM